MPAVNKFQEQINNFYYEHEQNRQMVGSLDESLATKASKVEFFELRSELMLVATKKEAKDF